VRPPLDIGHRERNRRSLPNDPQASQVKSHKIGSTHRPCWHRGSFDLQGWWLGPTCMISDAQSTTRPSRSARRPGRIIAAPVARATSFPCSVVTLGAGGSKTASAVHDSGPRCERRPVRSYGSEKLHTEVHWSTSGSGRQGGCHGSPKYELGQAPVTPPGTNPLGYANQPVAGTEISHGPSSMKVHHPPRR
jgi:hypothetical protein